MRGLKTTIALVVVLGGLFAYIYFVTWKQPEGAGDSASKPKEKVFASLAADKIDELKVSSSAGDATTLKKDNGAWQMTQPVAAKADETETSGITSALTSLEISRVVDENPTSLNDYGLSNPKIEIDFKAAGDKEYRKLLLGEKTPTGSDLFAKRNDEKRVFLVQAFQESTFDKKTFDLRDKILLKFDRDKVDGLDVTAGGKPLAFAKDGADWKITKPVQVKGDFGSVEGLIGKLQNAAMKSIAADQPTPADLKKYGLDKPDVTVNLAAGSTKATLIVGSKAESNTVYARDLSKPMVVTLESSLLDDLKKGADDYRRKDLFEFRAYNATRVEFTRGGESIVFERVKAAKEGDPDKWSRVSPKPADADRDKVDALLAKLANMRASSFVESQAKTGLDKPALVVYAKFDDGKKEERISFGKNGDDVYATIPGATGAAKTDAADLTEALKSLDELIK